MEETGTAAGSEPAEHSPQTDEAGGGERFTVLRLLYGTFTAQTVGAAVRLGIMDAIGEDTRTAKDIAADCATDSGATHRLLRALTALGLLTEPRAGAYALTEVGAALRRDAPRSLAALADVFTDPLMVRGWERLDDAVRSGRPVFPEIFGKSYFDHLADDQELSARFNLAMGESSRTTAELLPDAYDFSRFGTVVDVGGGDGTLLAFVMRRHPRLRGTVYDTAAGLAQAAEVMDRAGVADRFSAVTGDFFTSVPEGGDLYILKAVLHDWDDEQCVAILRNIRDAIPAHGRLLVVEGVLPARVDPGLAGGYLGDLNMLVNLGGRERTGDDFRALCVRAGFTFPTMTPLPSTSGFSLLEAFPAHDDGN
ncbi:methyltransferase [Streptomyces sp. 8N114]|uniref:methyltransferase n=1 Tax=Streptomyces sp. 8N114 TaxID=3457419 RepID=UPI003FD2E125